MANDKMTKKKYDLEERTARFAENAIRFCKTIKINSVNKSLIKQFIRAATSVAANYCEADDAESRNDFKHKIGICKKEARECKSWLRMLTVSNPEVKKEARKLWQEAKELHLIFNTITHSTKKNKLLH